MPVDTSHAGKLMAHLLAPERVRDADLCHPGLVAVPHACGASLATTGNWHPCTIV